MAIHRWTWSWTKAFWFNIQAERQGSVKQPILYGQLLFGEQKQEEGKVRVKETGLTWSQFFPVTLRTSSACQGLCWVLKIPPVQDSPFLFSWRSLSYSIYLLWGRGKVKSILNSTAWRNALCLRASVSILFPLSKRDSLWKNWRDSRTCRRLLSMTVFSLQNSTALAGIG